MPAIGYDQFTYAVRYILETGLAGMPAAAATGTAASVVQNFAPCGMKIVRWCAVRTGGKPKLPHPVSPNQNEVFQGGWIQPYNAARTTTGQPQVRIEGEYRYILKVPVWIKGPMIVGRSPLDNTGDALIITPEDFDPNLLWGQQVTPQAMTNQDLGPGFVPR